MGLFKISPGIPENEDMSAFVSYEAREHCPKCDKPYYESQCEKHPHAEECCYNMHLRKQHLKVVQII